MNTPTISGQISQTFKSKNNIPDAIYKNVLKTLEWKVALNLVPVQNGDRVYYLEAQVKEGLRNEISNS